MEVAENEPVLMINSPPTTETHACGAGNYGSISVTTNDNAAPNSNSPANNSNANHQQPAANNCQSLTMVIWLTLQLVLSAVMTTLSAFHQFVPGSTLPCTANVSDGNGTITSWPLPNVLSAVSMVFTILLLIFSVVDATINMHHLVHQVPHKKTDEKCEEHEVNAINSFYSKFPIILSDFCSKFPVGAIRVCYCWLIVNVIMLLVTANTYEWSWPTDHLKVLSNTALFLFIWIFYIFLLAGILVWHYNLLETRNRIFYVSILSLLIIPNTIFIAVASVLATNCSDLEANFGSQIYIRNVSAIVLIAYVLLSTLIWLVLVVVCYRKQLIPVLVIANPN